MIQRLAAFWPDTWDALKVRTYLKDTLDRYERPHGLLLSENRVVCWGKADDWKLVLTAAHERAFPLGVSPLATGLMPPLTRFITASARSVVEDAAAKLGICHLVWYDPFDRLERPASTPARLVCGL